MAEQLGSAVLTLGVETAQFRAGLDASLRDAQRKGAQIQQALNARQTRVDSNQAAVVRLQRELINADAARAGEIRKRISLLQVENREQQAGIAVLRQKLAANRQVEASIAAQIQKQRQARQDLAGNVKGGAGALAGGIGLGALAGVGSAAALGAFLKQSIDAAVELESITKKLSNTLGPQGAAGALAFTKGLSDQLGLSFKTLAGSFASFTAAATAANVPIQVQKDLFAAVSKAAQQLGLSNDEINGSLLALQQIASKGTVSMEELRGQLGERLPIAFAAAAKGLGVTQRELIKLVESGGLTATEFFPAITKGLNELTSASAGAPTAAQNFQKLQNALDQVQTSVGKEILPTLTDQVKNLTGVLEGVGVVLQANKLGLGGGIIGNSLGIIPEQGSRAVGALKALQNQFNLTDEQARALFTDAIADAGGRYNPFGQLIIDGKSFDNALASLVQRAIEFRQKNKDTTSELNAQQAAAAKLLAAENARAEAQKKYLDGPRQALRDVQALQGLQGAALQLAQQQLNIDKLRTAERKAAAEYDKALIGASFDRDNPAVITAAAKLEGASFNLRAALIEGSTALEQSAREAARQLQQASTDLRNAQQLAATPTFSTGDPGPARAALQQVQGIRQSIAQARQASDDAARSVAQAFNNGLQGEALQVLIDTARAAGERLKGALVSGADALRLASRQAVEALKQSRLELSKVVADPQGLNRFLPTGAGQLRIEEQLQGILPTFREAQRTFERLTGFTAPEIQGPTAADVLTGVQDFIQRVNTEQRAQESVQLNGKALETINAELKTSTDNLAAQIAALAAKNWSVKVNVPGGTASGDLIGAVNGGF